MICEKCNNSGVTLTDFGKEKIEAFCDCELGRILSKLSFDIELFIEALYSFYSTKGNLDSFENNLIKIVKSVFLEIKDRKEKDVDYEK